ncbi:MAG: glycerate kinase [Firmicutes bacterium]|nr:glycerate kinase [Bacillota bacterium]
MSLREDADRIVKASIDKMLPDEAVVRVLKNADFEDDRVHLVAVGKAAWQMAKAACDYLGDRLSDGMVITKYGHVKGLLPRVECFEAGHPVPDENGFSASRKVLDFVSPMGEKDVVVFLLSGGGSALFEVPRVSAEELQDVTGRLLACGASITEINTIRKRLSAVKGGRFAKACAPATVFSIILSDVVGPPDMIASGPCYPDSSTSEDAFAIVSKYGLKLSDAVLALLGEESPKDLNNTINEVTGSVSELCAAASQEARALGYTPVLLTDCLGCEAREAGSFLGSIAKTYCNSPRSMAFIAGGETVVHLTGKGRGGRNQEIALSAARIIAGLQNTAVFSVGSDGTDGPTDAAGGYADGFTAAALREKGVNIDAVLAENDSYRALESCGGLIITGPTGTNVNDVSVVLVKKPAPAPENPFGHD